MTSKLLDESPISLHGNLLIAMPSMEDTRFHRSVIYLCAHSQDGAMGLVLNQLAANISFRELLLQLNILDENETIQIPVQIDDMLVHKGGPVESGRGFVLHSADYFVESSTLPIDENISLTATLDILKAIAKGKGPSHAILALGYAGWAPGQLESEIQANGWLHCAADSKLLFQTELDQKYEKALQKLGIDLCALSGDAGHA